MESVRIRTGAFFRVEQKTASKEPLIQYVWPLRAGCFKRAQQGQ